MNAGSELDALVAEKVMGHEPVTVEQYVEWLKLEPGAVQVLKEYGERYMRDPASPADCLTAVPNYSGDIACAWQVVEKLIQQGFHPHMMLDADNQWVVSGVDCEGVPIDRKSWNHSDLYGYAPTLPMAICRAALQLAGITELTYDERETNP